MITDTMQVRCCISEAEQLIDQVRLLGLDFLSSLTFTVLFDKNTVSVFQCALTVFTWTLILLLYLAVTSLKMSLWDSVCVKIFSFFTKQIIQWHSWLKNAAKTERKLWFAKNISWFVHNYIYLKIRIFPS